MTGQAEAFGHFAGTSLHLKVTSASKTFLEVSEDASKLARFVDDKKTDLSKQRRQGFGSDWLKGPTRIAPDGHSCVLQIGSDVLPAPGATRLSLKATVAILCGSQEKTATQPDVQLKVGRKLKLGPIPLAVQRAEDGGWNPDTKFSVTLASSTSLAKIKELAFLGPGGKEIPHRLEGSGTMGMPGSVTYTRRYGLSEKVAEAGLRITYFEKTETLNVPIDITTGVGIGGAAATAIAPEPAEPVEPPAPPRPPAHPLLEARHQGAPVPTVPAGDAEKAARGKLSLASNYLTAGRKERAIQLYKEIVAQYPQTESAKTAKEQLKALASESGS